MTFHSLSERKFQTIAFESGGIVLAATVCALIFDASAVLMAVLSVAVMIWSPLHNSVFDWLDWRLRLRLASHRPHGLRPVQVAR